MVILKKPNVNEERLPIKSQRDSCDEFLPRIIVGPEKRINAWLDGNKMRNHYVEIAARRDG
jgi:hypothetical protein